MSKSILVIDTPKSCSECELKKICKIYQDIKSYDIQGYQSSRQHPQCPLQDTTELIKKYDKLQIELESYLTRMAYKDIEPYLIKLLQKIEALGGKHEQTR